MTSRVITRPAEEIDAPYVTACEYRGGWDLWVEFNNGASAVVDMSYLKNHPRFPVKHRHFRKPEVTLGSVGWGGEDDGLVISPDDLYIRAGFATSEEMFPEPDAENFAMPKSVKDADNGKSIFVEFGDGTAGYLKVTASLFLARNIRCLKTTRTLRLASWLLGAIFCGMAPRSYALIA